MAIIDAILIQMPNVNLNRGMVLCSYQSVCCRAEPKCQLVWIPHKSVRPQFSRNLNKFKHIPFPRNVKFSNLSLLVLHLYCKSMTFLVKELETWPKIKYKASIKDYVFYKWNYQYQIWNCTFLLQQIRLKFWHYGIRNVEVLTFQIIRWTTYCNL